MVELNTLVNNGVVVGVETIDYSPSWLTMANYFLGWRCFRKRKREESRCRWRGGCQLQPGRHEVQTRAGVGERGHVHVAGRHGAGGEWPEWRVGGHWHRSVTASLRHIILSFNFSIISILGDKMQKSLRLPHEWVYYNTQADTLTY